MAVLQPTEFNYFTLGANAPFTQISFTKPAAQGDFILRMTVSVTAAATSTLSIRDGATGGGFALMPANMPIGIYTLNIESVSVTSGGWGIQTGVGVLAWITGRSSEK